MAEENELLAEATLRMHTRQTWAATKDEVSAMATELQSLRNAQSEAVAVKSSCPTCNGTGDHCGNPDFGQCDDCGGTGWLHALTHPAPPLAVTDEMVERLARHMWDGDRIIGWDAAVQVAAQEPNSSYHETLALFRSKARAALTAALEAKQ